jgi:membrane protein YqaA with SNARE-associated domain
VSPLAELALVVGIVFAVNLLPAFGPPTWAVLIFLSFHVDLPAPLLVGFGAVAAAAGRMVLAVTSRRFRGRLSSRSRANLEAANVLVSERPGRSLAVLGLFALSPIPSGQLFVAAGLMELRIVPLTAAFFAGRVVSYSIYLGAADLARESLGSVFERVVSSPVGIIVQVLLLAAIVGLTRVDWAAHLSSQGRGERRLA